MKRITYAALLMMWAAILFPASASGQQEREDRTFFEKPADPVDKSEEAVGEGPSFPPSNSACLPPIRQPGETDAEFEARREDYRKRCVNHEED